MSASYTRLDPIKRREVNARYYRNRKARDPQAKRAQEKRWRDRNRDVVNSSAREYYDRNRADIIFKNKVYTLLMNVRKAVMARGLEPFDG